MNYKIRRNKHENKQKISKIIYRFIDNINFPKKINLEKIKFTFV